MHVWFALWHLTLCSADLQTDPVSGSMPANVSLACQWTQLAGQIMRHWHAAILIHFVSRDQVLFFRVFGSLFTLFFFRFLLMLAVLVMFHSDLSPPPLAPFDHRIVTPKPHQIASYYTINRDEVLGGWVDGKLPGFPQAFISAFKSYTVN